MTFCYSHGSVPYSVIIRETGTHARFYAERQSLELTALNRVFPSKHTPPEVREPHRRRRRKNVGVRRNGGHQRSKALWAREARHIWAHRAHSNHKAYSGPHQILCVYITAFRLVFFYGLLSLWTNGSLILVPSLGSPFPSVALPCLFSMWWPLI